jgi:hypothetical protein
VEAVLIVIAFWIGLFALYVAWPFLRWSAIASLWRRPDRNLLPELDLTRSYNEQIKAATESLMRPQIAPRPTVVTQEPRPLVHGLSLEVDRLRAQVAYLQSELEARPQLPAPAPQPEPRRPRASNGEERPRRGTTPNRYRSGAYTTLPKPLRHQVNQVRSHRG